jgi:hypothetical protein
LSLELFLHSLVEKLPQILVFDSKGFRSCAGSLMQEQEQATAKAKYGGLSAARRTVRLSVASVEMTWGRAWIEGQATAKAEADPSLRSRMTMLGLVRLVFY